MAKDFGPPPDEVVAFGPPPDEAPAFGPPPDEMAAFGPPPDEVGPSKLQMAVQTIPGETIPQKISGLLFPIPGASFLKRAAEMDIPFVAPARKYVLEKLGAAEGAIAEAGGRAGMPPALVAGLTTVISLPSETLARSIPSTIGEGALTAVAPLMKLPVKAPPTATPEQVATLASAMRGVEKAAEGVTLETLGKPRIITPPAPATAELGKLPAVSRIEAQEANLKAALDSAAKAELSKTLGPSAAETAAPRLNALPPDEAAAAVAELKAATSGPTPIVKPITDAPTTQNLEAVVERMARPRLESEQALLGLQKSAGVWESTANDLLRMKASGAPLTPKQAETATAAVIEGIETGEFSLPTGASMLGYDMSTEMGRVGFMEFLRESSSSFGFGLSQVSRAQKAMAKAFADAPELQKYFNEVKLGGVVLEQGFGAKVMELIRKEELFRRAGLVSAPSTAITNAISQAEFSAANMYEDLISSVLGVVSGKIKPTQVMDDVAADTLGFMGKLSPERQEQVLNVLKEYPFEHRRLLDTASADLTMDQTYVKMLTGLNAAQDRFYAKAGFDAYIRQTMQRTGKSLDQLTETDVRMAMDHARTITYSSAPRSTKAIEMQRKVAVKDFLESLGKPKEKLTSFDLEAAVKYSERVVPDASYGFDVLGSEFLRLYNKMPFLSAIGPTFPRFTLNAMRRIYNLSPLPLFRPSTYTAMADPDPRKAFKAISQVMTGTTYFGIGYALAEMGLWGDKLNEIQVGDKQYNVNKYVSTFAAPMMTGRLLHDYQKDKEFGLIRYSPEEVFQLFTSLRRDDMNKIPLLDVLDDESSPKTKMQALMRVFDSFASTLPPKLLGTFPRDVVGVFRDEGAKQRYLRRQHVLAPIKDQIVLWNETLPEYRSPIKEGPVYRGETSMERAMRLAGIVGKKKTPLESELDRLGVRPRKLWPRTGMEDWDYDATIVMGKWASKNLGELMGTRMYMLSDPKIKKLLMEEELRRLQTMAQDASKNTKDRALYNLLESKSALDEELLRREMKKRGIKIPE